MTAGTVFDRPRTPLTVWFTAAWLFATGEDGVSVLSLQRSLEISSYQTAWALPHGAAGGRVRYQPPRLRVGARGAWRHGHHQRLAGLQRPGGARVLARPA